MTSNIPARRNIACGTFRQGRFWGSPSTGAPRSWSSMRVATPNGLWAQECSCQATTVTLEGCDQPGDLLTEPQLLPQHPGKNRALICLKSLEVHSQAHASPPQAVRFARPTSTRSSDDQGRPLLRRLAPALVLNSVTNEGLTVPVPFFKNCWCFSVVMVVGNLCHRDSACLGGHSCLQPASCPQAAADSPQAGPGTPMAPGTGSWAPRPNDQPEPQYTLASKPLPSSTIKLAAMFWAAQEWPH